MRTDRFRSQIQGAVAEIMSLAGEENTEDPVAAMSEILEGFVSRVVADDTQPELTDGESGEPKESPQPDQDPAETPKTRSAAAVLRPSSVHQLDTIREENSKDSVGTTLTETSDLLATSYSPFRLTSAMSLSQLPDKQLRQLSSALVTMADCMTREWPVEFQMWQIQITRRVLRSSLSPSCLGPRHFEHN